MATPKLPVTLNGQGGETGAVRLNSTSPTGVVPCSDHKNVLQTFSTSSPSQKTARDRNVAAEHEKASATGGKKGQRKRVPSIDEDPSHLPVQECAKVLRDELEKVKEENLEVQLAIDQIPKLKGLNDNGTGILAKLLDDPASLSITEELKEFIDIAENAEDNSRMENQKRRKRQRRLPDGPSTSKE